MSTEGYKTIVLLIKDDNITMLKDQSLPAFTSVTEVRSIIRTRSVLVSGYSCGVV